MAKTRTKPRGGAATAPLADSQVPYRICYDRVVSDEASPALAVAERVAVEQAAHNRATQPATRGPDASGVITTPRAAIVNLKKWQNGSALTCRFLDGDATQKKKVQAKAHLWEQYANVTFKFITKGTAQIRISFSADPGSWSAVGTDALVERYFPRYQPTMNYGWLRDDTDDTEYERVVVHEFGHALGLIHEHQSPTATLKWNTAEVYRSFSGPPNYWSKEEIDSNILQKYGPQGITATVFDPDSIMLYQFDGRLFTDGKPTPMNTKLSDRDKAFIAQMYPKTPKAR
jgi:hypothetical protein